MNCLPVTSNWVNHGVCVSHLFSFACLSPDFSKTSLKSGTIKVKRLEGKII